MKIAFLTLGCKVNQCDSGELLNRLLESGHTRAESVESADAAVINTCAVTAESARKSKQTIRRVRRENPRLILAVMGCFSEAEPEAIEALGADFYAGAGEISKIAAFLSNAENPVPAVECRGASGKPLPGGRTRAFLKVQSGCDNFCTYCIIPHLRGPSKSVPLLEAAERARELSAAGFLEIVLVGIELSSYGPDVNANLADLIEAVAEAAPAARIRLGSLEPGTVTEEFLGRISRIPAAAPHFHLSLQSGCDRTLSRMGRKYTSQKYREALSRVRRFYDDPAITTDVICGFPGETEEDFEETLHFCRECGFSAMHIFPYSRREKTPASGFPDQVPEETKRCRVRILAELSHEMQTAYLDRQRGKILRVLFEQERDGFLLGHSENYLEVTVKDTGLKGKLVPVKISGRDGERLLGDLAGELERNAP